MKRAEILEAARVCVCGEREQDYGTPENNKVLKFIIAESGFELLARIEIKDKKTGRCFR